MYQEIQYRLYINKSQIKQFRYHNGSFTFKQQENVSGW